MLETTETTFSPIKPADGRSHAKIGAIHLCGRSCNFPKSLDAS